MKKKTPRVKIRELLPVLDTDFPIWKFHSILRRFADLAGTGVVAYTSQTKESPTPHPDDSSLFLCFLPRSTTASDQEEALNSIFGYSTRQPLRYWKVFVNPFYAVHNYDCLWNFEGQIIARFSRRTIYLDFDFLKKYWEGHEDTLNLIFYFGLARILAPLVSDAEVKKIGQRFAQVIGRDLASKEKDGMEEFGSFLQETAELFWQSYAAELENQSRILETVERDLVRVAKEIAELEEYLSYLEKSIPDDAMLAEEFATLLRLQGVARVEIKGDNLVVSTHRLTQFYPPLNPLRRKAHDIGSYEIIVSPNSENQLGVLFRSLARGLFRSPYLPSYISNQATIVCFGSSNLGLNLAVSKQISDYNIPALLALIFSFARMVDQEPQSRKIVIEDNISVEELNSQTLGYDNEAAYESAKEEYIKLAKRVRLQRLSHSARTKLESVQKSEAGLKEKFVESRLAGLEKKHFLVFLKERQKQAAEQAPKIWAEIKKHPWVLSLEMKRGLRIWLYDPEKFPYPAILWLEAGKALRFLYPYYYYGRRYQSHSPEFPKALFEEILQDLTHWRFPELLEKIIAFVIQPTPDYGGS